MKIDRPWLRPAHACLAALLALAAAPGGEPAAREAPAAPPPQAVHVHHLEYLRARPGMADDYDRFVKEVFRPMLDEMVARGIWVRWRFQTVPYAGPAPCADYTHVFTAELRNFAAVDRELEEWGAVIRKFHPDAAERRRLFDEELPRLREMVREEFLRDFDWR